MAKDTGFPGSDAQFDFSRARRRRALSRLANTMRREPDDVNVIMPFEEVVQALGRRGQRNLGLQTIELDTIVARWTARGSLTGASTPPPAGSAHAGRA